MAAPRVLVVCADLRQNDQIMNELVDAGLDATPAFTADEALGELAERRFEAVVIAEDIEDGMVGLLRWMGKRHKGLVVTLPERHAGAGDDELATSSQAGVVARLVATLGAQHGNEL